MQTDSTSVQSSDAGIAIHAPFSPHIRGKTSRNTTLNNSVLQKEINADIFPLERAVKNPEDAILNPLNRKLIAKIWNPTDASSHVPESFVNIVTIGFARTAATTVIATDEAITKMNVVL